MEQTSHTPARPLGQSLARGWRKRCPNCGEGRLLDGYLSVADACGACGAPMHHHRADDAPAWLTIIVVGHLIAPVMLGVYKAFDLPTWAHAAIWPTLAILLVLWFLPRLKGAVVGFQWSQRMHGFDGA